MAFYPNSVINALSSLSNVNGVLTQLRIDLLANIDLQWKNNFEVLFYPHNVNAETIASSALDTVITSLYVQNITGINLPTLEYTDINGIKHLTGITAPEEVTFEFLETDVGLVRLFLQLWSNSIYAPVSPFESGKISIGSDPLTINQNVNTEGNSYYYTFKDDQRGAKKNALIILKGTTGLPGIGGWIHLEGLKLKTASGFDIGQGEEGPMLITVPMSVDMIKFIVPASYIPSPF